MQAFDFAKLYREARTFGAAHGIQKKFCQMCYYDGESWVIVEEENDLQLAYAFAARSENSIIFSIVSKKGQPKEQKAKKEREPKVKKEKVPVAAREKITVAVRE